MAEIDASIPLQVKPIQFQTPFELQTQMNAMQQGQNQNRLAQMQFTEADRANTERNQMRDAYAQSMDANGVVDQNKLYGIVAKTQGDKIPGMQKAYNEAQSSSVKLNNDKLEGVKRQAAITDDQKTKGAQRITAHLNDPNLSKESVLEDIQSSIQSGESTLEQAKPIMDHISQLPEGREPLAGFLTQIRTKMLSPQQQVDGAAKERDFAYKQTNDQANRDVTIAGQDKTDARAKAVIDGAESAFTPDAIENAAARYNIDGTLPPMGMGKAGAMGRSAILNRAAEQAKANGINGDDQRIAQIGNKASTAALSQLQKQQTMVGAFEKNFSLNSDMALELSKNVDRSGSPLLNSWLQAGQKNVTGNVALSKFHAANETVINEYAKIMSGSMGNTAVSDSARQHAHSLLSTVQNQDQYEGVMQTLRRETANRMQGFEDEKNGLRGSFSGKKNAPTAGKTQSGATISGW